MEPAETAGSTMRARSRAGHPRLSTALPSPDVRCHGEYMGPGGQPKRKKAVGGCRRLVSLPAPIWGGAARYSSTRYGASRFSISFFNRRAIIKVTLAMLLYGPRHSLCHRNARSL